MWTSGIAIRPVPPYAVIDARTVESVRDALTPEDDEDETEKNLDDAFGRFEATQPALSARLEDALERRSLDETARTLGYFLGVSVWLAFDKQFGNRLMRVDETMIRAASDSLDLESEVRASRPGDALEADDVVAREQPALMEFIHEHVDVALERPRRGHDEKPRRGHDEKPRRGHDEKPRVDAVDADVDDVYGIYRIVLVELLSLSHAVAPHPGTPIRRGEVLA